MAVAKVADLEKWWVSCDNWTVQVNVNAEDGRIVWAAPLVRRFIGQRFDNLLYWAKSFGGLRTEKL